MEYDSLAVTEAAMAAARDRSAWPNCLGTVLNHTVGTAAAVFVLRQVSRTERIFCVQEEAGVTSQAAKLRQIAFQLWNLDMQRRLDWAGLSLLKDHGPIRIYGELCEHTQAGYRHLVAVSALDHCRRFAFAMTVPGDCDAALDDAFQHLSEIILAGIRVTVRNALHLKREEALLGQVMAAPVGVLMLNSHGEIVRQNRLAEQIIGAADAISLDQGTIRIFGEDGSSIRFEKLKQEILEASTKGRIQSNAVYQLNDHNGLPVYYVRIFALVGCRNRPDEPAAIVTIADASIASWLCEDNVAGLFSLTRTEARLAIHIAQGKTLAVYADENGISELTARTHMRNIFSKLGISRQTELMQTIMGSAPVCVSQSDSPPWLDIVDLVYQPGRKALAS